MGKTRFKYSPAAHRTKYGMPKTPSIPVILYGTKAKLNTLALVDSGADFSLLRKDVADEIEIKYYPDSEEEIGGIGGGVKVKNGQIEVRISDNRTNFRVFPLHVAVPLENVEFGEILILGRKDFFETFIIEFREKSEDIAIKENPEKLYSRGR